VTQVKVEPVKDDGVDPEIKSLVAAVNKLTKSVASLQDQNTTLSENLTVSRKEIDSLKDKNAIVCQDNQQLRADTSKLQTEVQTLKTEQALLKESIAKLSTKVAFNVHLTKNITLQKDEVIIFDACADDEGSEAYDCSTGIFSVPVSGLYFFTASVSPWSRNSRAYSNACFMVDGCVNGGFLAKGENSATGHLSVTLEAGQKVWLRCGEDKSKFAGHGSYLTGILVQPDV
jgi:FtsZ-binding cell division protein ZapB